MLCNPSSRKSSTPARKSSLFGAFKAEFIFISQTFNACIRLVNKGLIPVATAATAAPSAAAPKTEAKAAPTKTTPVAEAKKKTVDDDRKKDDDELSMSAGSLTKYANGTCSMFIT